jgi:hypothetical protein
MTSRDVYSTVKATLDYGAPMVWTPPFGRGLRWAVRCIEGEQSWSSLVLVWIWPGDGDSARSGGRRQKLLQEGASVSRRGSVLCPNSDRAAAAPDYPASANLEIVICAPCWSMALERRSDGFEKSRIREACG